MTEFYNGLTGSHSSAGPLSGVKVVELSSSSACCPAAAAMLSDLGAKVVKLEKPGGDYWRPDKPFFVQLNRGKTLRRLSVDALSEELEDASIFLTDFPMSSLKAVGADYATLHAALPRLCFVCMTPWGVTGPASLRSCSFFFFGTYLSRLQLNCE